MAKRAYPDSLIQQIGEFFGTNARCRATRSRSLGWKPKYATSDMLASIKAQVENIKAKN